MMNCLKVQARENYDILELNRGKANPINTEMVVEIRDYFKKAKAEPATRGVIITGNHPGYFSVGLDLKELFYYNEKDIMNFWKEWDAMIMELVKFPKPFFSAINGYSPAGGCVLAVTTDYRMMAEGDSFIIGLNEVAAGIVVPEYIYQLYAFWVGKRVAYHNLMRGKLMGVQEALDCHLIDEVHPMENLLGSAEKKMQSWLRSPDNLLQLSKLNMRAELIDRIESLPSVEEKEKLKAWFDPASRLVMQSIVDKLAK